jgi:serine/threonine-protein kinase
MSDGLLDLGRIGRGGGGEIRVARDLILLRKVAHKRILPEVERVEGMVERFLREVQITAQLDHPGIIPVYGLEGNLATGLGYSMKLVHGATLQERLTRAAVDGASYPLRERLEEFLQVCDTVHHAHSRGVVHRDLKPANIMIGPFRAVYVMDWGIARAIGERTAPGPESVSDAPGTDNAGETLQGMAIGTPPYMSPEQAHGRHEDLDGRSDLYALGLILQETLTLSPAFRRGPLYDMLRRAGEGDREPLEFGPGGVSIDRELVAIVERATRIDVGDRYPDVDAFADDLRRHLRNEAPQARPDNLWRATTRWLARHRSVAAFTILALALVASWIGVGAMVRQARLQGQARERELESGRFLTVIARRAQRIDEVFLRLAGRVEALAVGASTLLEHGRDEPRAFYTDLDFGDPERAPPDLAFSERYGKPVSFEWPVFKLAPGTDVENVRRSIDCLARLNDLFRRAFRVGIGEDEIPPAWIFVGLENGVHCAYPGKSDYDAAFDPRLRPWYRAAAGDAARRWGSPYLDAQGQGLILPAVQAIRDGSGSLVGVAGIDYRIDDLVDALLLIPGEPRVVDAYLIDEEGRILLRHSDREALLRGERFHYGPVLEAIAAGGGGFRPTEGGGSLV